MIKKYILEEGYQIINSIPNLEGELLKLLSCKEVDGCKTSTNREILKRKFKEKFKKEAQDFKVPDYKKLLGEGWESIMEKVKQSKALADIIKILLD